jgi:tRNA threonylcarbamoyladenosine biosynthesis protein TsaE
MKIFSHKDMDRAVEKFLACMVSVKVKKDAGAQLVLLEGELGAGKTTFVQALARSLGVKERVTSPTFVIQKTYALPSSQTKHGFKRLVHIDAYRLNSLDDLRMLGWGECVADPHALILLEWPERVREVYSHAGRFVVSFFHSGEYEREIVFDGKSEMS